MHHGRIEEQSPRPTSLAKWYNHTDLLIPGGEYGKHYTRGTKDDLEDRVGQIEEQSPRPTSLAKWYNRTNDFIPGGEYSKQ